MEIKYVIQSNGVICSIKGKKVCLLKQTRLPNGYLQVSIMNNGKCESKLVHRLVAQSFLNNEHNKPCVNHKDGNKENNNITNLEWCTYSENELHSYRVLNKKANKTGTGKFGILNGNSKPIWALIENKYIYFESISLAAKKLNVFDSNINKVLSGQYKHTGGYIFKYA
jgi:hypothetical protein